MRCPKCKGGQGLDRYNADSLAKHLTSFHHVTPEVASEAEARDSFVEAVDSMISEVAPRDTEADALDRKLREFEVLHPIDKTAITEQAEAGEAVKRLGLFTPMPLSSKLCWSWLATVLLVGLTLVALVLVTKV